MRFITAGESHGPELTAIIEGLPAGLPLSSEEINRELARRQGGYGRGGRMKIEKDQVRITSGIRHGKTLGSPVTLIVENKDWKNWTSVMSVEPVPEKQKIIVYLQMQLFLSTLYHKNKWMYIFLYIPIKTIKIPTIHSNIYVTPFRVHTSRTRTKKYNFSNRMFLRKRNNFS